MRPILLAVLLALPLPAAAMPDLPTLLPRWDMPPPPAPPALPFRPVPEGG